MGGLCWAFFLDRLLLRQLCSLEIFFRSDVKVAQDKSDLADKGGAVADSLTDGLDPIGLPAPVKRNFWKAFGRLCTATTELGVAHIEGWQQEKRAETSARVQLIRTSADQIATQMHVDPEYARAAASKFGQRIVREQMNLDSIASKSLPHVRQKVQGTEANGDSNKEISEDFMHNFEREASPRNSSEMQELFARILAGEVCSPGRYSVRTLKLVGALDTEVLNIFSKFCSMCSSIVVFEEGQKAIVDSRLLSLGQSLGSNGLSRFGFGFESLNTLVEYGLISYSLDASAEYWVVLRTPQQNIKNCFLQFNQQFWKLVAADEKKWRNFKVHGAGLTKAGQEIFEDVPRVGEEIVLAYHDALADWMQKLGVDMRQAEIPGVPPSA